MRMLFQTCRQSSWMSNIQLESYLKIMVIYHFMYLLFLHGLPNLGSFDDAS